MAGRAEEQKSELVETLCQRARKRLDANRADDAVRFLKQFYANVAPDDILEESVENLYGAALSLWGQAQQRDKGQAKVRVYNPRPDEYGWKSSHTVVEIVNDDMPFLVDSVTAAIGQLEADVYLVIHPVFRVERDGKGKLKKLFDNIEGDRRESIMQLQISEQPAERQGEIGDRLEQVLADVRIAVADWKTMCGQMDEVIADLEKNPPPIPKAEIDEGIAFLKWLNDDHFTYIGYREYRFEGQGRNAVSRVLPEVGLGVLRNISFQVFDGLRNLGSLPAEVQDFVKKSDLLRVTKANSRSSVHRAVHMDTVAIKVFDGKGKVVGERLFIGLFTSVAYSRSPRDIPLLRKKVDNLVARSGFSPGSHDGKTLTHILESYPRDELFQMTEDELFDTAMGVLHLQERQRIALFLRRDPFERFVTCLIYVPRDRYDSALRLRMQSIVAEAFNGAITAFYTHLTDEALARLHIIVKTTRGEIPDVDHDSLERKLAEAGRSWGDRLEEALIEDRGEERGIRNLRNFSKAFSASYQDHFNADDAAFDVSRIDEALDGDGLSMNLYRPLEAEAHRLHFKLYIAGRPVPLSDVLPMLENMGLKVISENPYSIWPAHSDNPVWLHDFEMVTQGGDEIDIPVVKQAFHEAFAMVWRGEMENDGFNRLVLRARLTARELTILRAYCKYLRQAQIPFSQSYMEETLAGNPEITRLLVDLFLCRFDQGKAAPRRAEARKAEARKAEARDSEAEAIVERIRGLLDQVGNLDEDRIIRRFLNAIQWTLRTNFCQTAEDGRPKSYLSFKLDSRNIDELPLPRPFREIFVYSPRVEGVHLRFGMVARGGLRWSDRREDFRTEILGLVKAQQVKNAVIVPVGSKGGFVVKQPPAAEAGREAYLAEGIECYKTLIRGLLDITDNLQAGKLVPPEAVVRRDDDDPYLVVAADKGTATFSDIANGVSIEYGFWLDDAFASGGSAGYDHKKMGITARGAWESVKRHFRELGKDIQSETFTCVGIGDMSGDVFGNGMLLSEQIKLVAAFNHMHIFIDPEPDPAASFAERRRLFDLPRSAWTDYNEKLISNGGGIFDRKAKSLKITREMKALFGISEESLTPNELLRAIMKSKVELLWFGGIGTYVKAKAETNADAGDRANDALRVDARDLGCKVIGEGANLGMTQRARVEFAQNGGYLNTDSIDNSAGVDCSDHEVNIKILLGDIEQAGDMTRKQRDKLLAKMTDEVGELVLRDNYLQTQAITVTQGLGAHLLDRFARFMRTLEKQGKLNRAIEFLPDDETITERLKQGAGLTRPELSVLLSYAKITLYEELLASDLPDDPYMNGALIGYFPGILGKDYAEPIARHRLRREIIATVVTNDMVNRVGITFVHEVREKTGMPAADIARAYTAVCEVFDLRALFLQIEALDNRVPAEVQAGMLVEAGRLIEQGTVWFLRNSKHPLDIEESIKLYATSLGLLIGDLKSLLSLDARRQLSVRTKDYRTKDVPEDVATRVASLALLVPAGDIVAAAQRAKLPVEQAGKIYFAIGDRFGFDWLRRATRRLPSDSAWDKLAVTAIVDDLYGHQSALTASVLNGVNADAGAAEVIDVWAAERQSIVARTEQLMAELNAAGNPDLAMLAVANRQLKSLVEI
jgi:glutamate dehydrogenase